MMSTSSDNRIYHSSTIRYCTLRYVTDWKREIAVPVGVAIWNREEKLFQMRMSQKGDRIADIKFDEASPYLLAAESQIKEWIVEKQLPYQNSDLPVLSDEWWSHVRKLFGFRIRLDEPKPIDCKQPAEELEALFEATVKPKQPRKERSQRLDRVINQALGELSSQFESHAKISAFKDRAVTVPKAVTVNNRILIVDGVNLAVPSAETDADALASKILRIKEKHANGDVIFALTFIASPGGLNGEGVLKDWIERQSGTTMYDGIRQKEEYADQIRRWLEEENRNNELVLF